MNAPANKPSTFSLLVDGRNLIRKEFKIFLCIFFLSLLVYAQLYTSGATNPDGYWDSGGGISRWFTSDWEYKIGRWARPFFVAIRSGMATPIIMSVFSLAVYSLTAIILVNLFGIKGFISKFLSGLLIVVTPAVCDSLTYYPYSDTFSLSLFFPVLVVASLFFCQKYERIPISLFFINVCLLTVALGLYQSNINVIFVLLCACTVLQLLTRRVQRKSYQRFFCRTLAVTMLACICYACILYATQSFLGVTLPEYRGVNDITIPKLISSLPRGIYFGYETFFETFLTHKIMGNYFGEIKLFVALAIVAIVLCGICIWKSKNIAAAVCVIVIMAAMPLAANMTLLMTPDTNVSVLMIGGAIVVLPFLFALSQQSIQSFISKKVSFAVGITVCLLVGLLNCSYILQVNADAMTMKSIHTQQLLIGNRIVQDLEHVSATQEGKQVCIIGTPDEGNYPIATNLAKTASNYAKNGCFWRTWDGVYHNWIMMINVEIGASDLKFCPLKTVKIISKEEEFKSMPCYPEDGSIQLIGDVVVVKVSTADYKD